MAEAIIVNNRHIDIDHLNHRLQKGRRELAKAKLHYMSLSPGEEKMNLGIAIANANTRMKQLEALKAQAPRITYFNGQSVPVNAAHGNGPC